MTYLCQPRLASLNPRLLTLEGASFIGGMFKQLPLATEEKSGMEFANRADCSPSFRPTTGMRHRSLACQNAFSCKVMCWARRPFAPCASAAASILQNGGSPFRTGPVLKKTTKRKSSR